MIHISFHYVCIVVFMDDLYISVIDLVCLINYYKLLS